MPFFVQVKNKLKKALGKLSTPFAKKKALGFRTPGRRGGTKLAKCLHCNLAWTRDPIQLCNDCKWNPYVNGPFFLDEEEEERKGGDKEVEAGEESRGEGKGAAEEHPPFESLLRGEFPYEVDE